MVEEGSRCALKLGSREVGKSGSREVEGRRSKVEGRRSKVGKPSPKGSHPPAQGCATRATLGMMRDEVVAAYGS